MDEINSNEVEQQSEVSSMSNDELKDAIKGTMEKMRTQAMLLGAQAICSTVLQKINTFERKQGKITMNDYKRLVRDINGFCEIGLSRKVNLDGTTSEKTDEEASTEEAES